MPHGHLQQLMTRLHGPVYASRTRELIRLILPHLREGDRVLDIGCGFGTLGQAMMDHPDCPAGVKVSGVERHKRGGEAIPVEAYDGRVLPYNDNTYDVTMIADVLHHEEDPTNLIQQAGRVASRYLIIKDHKVDGLCAQSRISLMDWAANKPYGIKCLYRYNSLDQWHQSHREQGFKIVKEHTQVRLYPAPYRWFFTDRLQYLAVLDVASA